METNPLLTIVIPAYNAFPYIEELISSMDVREIEDGKVEVIIVDDGSTDGTADYCDRLEAENNSYRVFHQPNSGGPAGPRNLGIEKARGEFVFFADADDLFVDGAISGMLDHLKTNRFSVGIFKVDASDWGMDYGGLFDASRDQCAVDNSNIMNSLGPYKVFRRSLVVENNIRFPEGVAYEDLPFTMECYLLAAGDISVISDRVYYKYTKREGTVSLSRATASSNATHGSMDKKIAGIEYYLSVAHRYFSPPDCPQIYERAMRYGLRNYSACLNGSGDDRQAQSIINILSESYCDEVRSQFAPTALASIDAMFCCDRLTAREVINARDMGLRLSLWGDPSDSAGGGGIV